MLGVYLKRFWCERAFAPQCYFRAANCQQLTLQFAGAAQMSALSRGCSCCLWLLVLLQCCSKRAVGEAWQGGRPAPLSQLLCPARNGGPGEGEMHPECALGQTWFTRCCVWPHLRCNRLKENLCALLLGYQEDREGKSILQSHVVLWASLLCQKVTFSFITAPNRLLLLQ